MAVMKVALTVDTLVVRLVDELEKMLAVVMVVLLAGKSAEP
jgi:hypothetical protein